MADLTQRIAKAKTTLVLDHPFIGTIALSMPFTINPDMPEPKTARTNGKRVEFDPDFVESLSDPELLFLVAHECMHPMLEHNFRRMGRDPGKWNKAADYVINQLLVDDKVGAMPKDGLQSKEIYDAGNGTSDGIYSILPDEPPQGGKGTPSDGDGWQDCEDGEGSQADQDQAAAEMKVTVAQAAQAAKMMGRLSANQARLVDEILNPKVDWREVLQQFVEKCKDDRRTWARPNRRMIPQGVYLPSRDGEAMGEIAFAIDCSGSIGQKELDQFAAEIKTVQEEQRPKTVHMIYFDSKVCHYDKFKRGEDVTVAPHGGGGTMFSPVFEYMAEHNIEPVACVFLTDLYCNDFGAPTDYPVLWVTTTEHRDYDFVPFGEVVEMG